MQGQNFFEELKRRNVFRVATAYAIAGWLIIQICTSTFPYLNLPGWLITAVIIFVAIGFPIALIFAWAFELTAEGLKKTAEVVPEKSVTKNTGKKLNRIIITSLSLLVVFLLVERVFFAQSNILDTQNTEVHAASIAVLPFVNMSSDAENEYFSDGLSEELLNVLAKVEGMQVAGRTSSFKFKGRNENLSEIADELGVRYILEGSVRKDGNRVRITAQLIKADDGYHMWSDTYDRELNDIFAIQDEISKSVLNELKVRLLPEDEAEIAKAPTQDIEAYNAYLRGTQLEISRISEDLELAIQQYKEAIRIDPTFALAYARLAIAYNLIKNYGSDIENIDELVRENVDRAIMLDSDIPEAYGALGLMYLDEGEYEKSIEAFAKAVDLNPNYGIVYSWMGNTYIEMVGKRQETIDSYRRAYEIDPENYVVRNNYIRSLMLEGKMDEALSMYEKQVRERPKFLFSYYRVSELYANYKGDEVESLKILLRASEIDEDEAITLGYLMFRAEALELNDYRDDLFEYFKSLYPNHPNVDRFTVVQLQDYEKYEELLPIIEKYRGTIGQEVYGEPALFTTYTYSRFTDHPELIREILRDYYPEFLDGSIEKVDRTIDGVAFVTAMVAKEDGEPELYNKMTDLLCSFAKDEEAAATDDLQSTRHFYAYVQCNALKGDKKETIKWLKEIENDQLIDLYDILREGRYLGEIIAENFPDDPVIGDMRMRSVAEFNRQRNDAIELLKNEGIWQEDWTE